MLRLIALLALLLPALLGGAARAQETDAPASDASATAALDEAHLALAEELLDLTGTQQAMDAATTGMLDAQIAQNPGMAPYRDILEDFFEEYISYAAVKGELVALYAERFTPSELEAAITFYSTPEGQRFAEEQPALMQRGMAIGQQRAQENQMELMQRITERERELSGETPPAQDAPGQEDPTDDGTGG